MRWTRLLSVLSLVSAITVFGAGVATAADEDPLGLTLDGGVGEGMGIGTDTVAVWVCEVAGTAEPKTFTPEEIVVWANTQIAPFFSLISRGRYTLRFEKAPGSARFEVADGGECLNEANTRTSDPRFTNSFVIDNTDDGGGLGGSGVWFLGGDEIRAARLDQPPSVTGRGLYAGGGTYDRPATVTHEIGHTLSWPHSGSSRGGLGDYDNPADLMSGSGIDNLCEVTTNSFRGPCFITHTLAFNRYASGWVDEDEIVIVARPDVVELAGPEVAGRQMALLPTANPLVFTTVEARPAVGFDAEAGVSGVMLHTVDQAASCSSNVCWGLNRRQYPAVGDAGSTDHILGVGESVVVNGMTVTVEEATTAGYRVAFTGSAAGCAMGPNQFTDVSAGSFALNDIGCIRTLGITTGTSPTTYSPADSVTREQMAAFLGRLYRALGESCATTTTPFSDIAGSFAAADVACIFDLAVTTGTSPTTYDPSGRVTREQMAAFLGRLWRDALGQSCSRAAPPFTDISGSFAAADVACIFDLGITTGTSPTTYDPKAPVTREQMAAFLARFWKAV